MNHNEMSNIYKNIDAIQVACAGNSDYGNRTDAIFVILERYSDDTPSIQLLTEIIDRAFFAGIKTGKRNLKDRIAKL